MIVVGATHGATGKYLTVARRLASQARSYGARVSEIYSPNATWARVKAAAKGANLLIYLGHGNGTPSQYTNRPESTNGMGLNASASGSHNNTKYYGSPYIDQIQLAPNAVVILNRLCYASGNNEWGAGNPTLAVATTRVDSYGWSFFRAGAKAVFAEGITDPSYVLKGLFKTNRTIEQIFWSSPNATDRYTRDVQLPQDAGHAGRPRSLRPQPLLPLGHRRAEPEGLRLAIGGRKAGGEPRAPDHHAPSGSARDQGRHRHIAAAGSAFGRELRAGPFRLTRQGAHERRLARPLSLRAEH